MSLAVKFYLTQKIHFHFFSAVSYSVIILIHDHLFLFMKSNPISDLKFDHLSNLAIVHELQVVHHHMAATRQEA